MHNIKHNCCHLKHCSRVSLELIYICSPLAGYSSCDKHIYHITFTILLTCEQNVIIKYMCFAINCHMELL